MSIKKLLSIFVLFCFCSLSWSQQSVQQNLSGLEEFLTSIENNSLTQQILIEDLQRQLQTATLLQENLQQQLKEVSEQQEMQLNLLKKYEFRCKVLKWSLVIGIPTSIIVTGTVCLSWANSH